MNNTLRNGFVRTNPGGVYKGVEAACGGKRIEYVVRKDRSGVVLAIALILVGAVIFALTHIELIRGLLA